VFHRAAEHWLSVAELGQATVMTVGLDHDNSRTDKDTLHMILIQQASGAPGPLWIVLIGHGTDDGRDARFNLRGPDVTARELADWLLPIQRPIAVIIGASSSARFLHELSKPNRVIVTATRSGSESNYARFGQFMAEAMSDPVADLDRDGQISLLEAYLTAAARVAEFYRSEGRLATEHSLLDDNGDRLGTPADYFEGVFAKQSLKQGLAADGVKAHQWILVPSEFEKQLSWRQRELRDNYEQELHRLRQQKATLKPDDYDKKLEELMVKLARLYQSAETQ
jgi:hypothetical protein